MKQYIHITTDGSFSVVDIAKEGSSEYQQLRELVGGYIEQVATYGNHRLVINETGLLDGLEINIFGTTVTGRLGDRYPIVGDTVLAGPLRGDGEFSGVDPRILVAVDNPPNRVFSAMLDAIMALHTMPDRAGHASSASVCPECGGTDGKHHILHTRWGNGWGGNSPCPLDLDCAGTGGTDANE